MIQAFLEIKMKIHRSNRRDIHAFHGFWNTAIDYQKERGLPLWPPFSEESMMQEIRSGFHFSARFPDGILAGYFSVALSDRLIWGAKEQNDAIYIHRMCVNPDRKGSHLTSFVLAWANGYASSLGKRFIRMDTWADNKQLADYYIECGFHYIDNRMLGDVPELPAHYSHTNLALFENVVC